MKGSLQVKNNIYQAVFSYKDSLGRNKTIWRSTKIPASRGNKRKALEVLEQIQQEVDPHPETEKILFVDYMDTWLENEKSLVDEITYEGYKSYLVKHIRPYFEPRHLTLQQVKLTDIEGYYKQKSVSGRLDGKPGGLSRRSLKLHSVVLSGIFKKAVRESLVTENPCDLAEIPKDAKNEGREIEFYNVEQCKELLEKIQNTPLYNMVYLTFLYGLRRSELMGLKWDAVDFERDTIAIRHTVVLQSKVVAKDDTKNKTSNRIYPLLEDVKQILLSIRQEQEENRRYFGSCYKESGYVFTKEDGSLYHPSYPSKALQKVLRQYNLPHIRWHNLRHSCASVLIDKGWSMKDISEWLGHADIGTTMNIYGHLDMEHKRNMAKRITGVLL